MAHSIKRVSIIAIIMVFITTFLLAALLFEKEISGEYVEEQVTYDVESGLLPQSGFGITVAFWFNVDSVPRFIHTATLTINVDNITYPPDEDKVYFIETDGTEHYLGLLKPPTAGEHVLYFNLDPDWVKVGKNAVRIDVEVCEFADIQNAKLYLNHTSWIRDRGMACKTVWINEDNNFEFIFDYYYADNNWVKIFDMDGNMVWEINFAYGKNRFVVEIPDGMYMVKTYHNDMDTPIQEFLIGKP